MDCLNLHKDGIGLLVKVMPRASRQALGPLRNGRLTVYLNAPPVEGAANQALLKFLAAILEVSPTALSITSGCKSRSKTVFIKHLAREQIAARLWPE